MLSRKHYVALAEALASVRREIEADAVRGPAVQDAGMRCLGMVVRELSQVLKQDNPRFDVERFGVAVMQDKQAKKPGKKQPSKPAMKFDEVAFIMAVEDGSVPPVGMAEGMQHLIDSGTVWGLQGSWQRSAEQMIQQGLCHR